MNVIIAGGGIGGLTAALSLHAAGVDVCVFEQARELRELGVGINLLPHATETLAALGLLPALDDAGIRTRELIYANRFGQVVWRELRGLAAGYGMPQYSIHRGRLHGVLARAALKRLGPSRIRTGCAIVDFDDRHDRVVARLERREDGRRFDVAGDALIGCDGTHSTVRAILYPPSNTRIAIAIPCPAGRSGGRPSWAMPRIPGIRPAATAQVRQFWMHDRSLDTCPPGRQLPMRWTPTTRSAGAQQPNLC